MGGIERYLLQTTQLLEKHPNFQPVVVCSAGGPLYQQMEALDVPLFGLPNRTFFAQSFLRSFDLPSFLETLRLLKQEKPDVIHVHMGLLENVLLQVLGYPVVYTFHGYGTLFSLAGVTNPLKRAFKHFTRFLFRETARRMDAMLVVSNVEHQRLIEEGYLPKENRAKVLHNGMPVAAWQEKVNAADGLNLARRWAIPTSPQSRRVVYFNRLDSNKNPLDFVAMAKLVTQAAQETGQPVPCFIMAGEGPLEGAMLKASADLPNFRYIGLCNDIPALLSLADVVVHPASREGFGLGLVEAMAAGVPVVAYDCGGPQEILNQPATRHLLAPVYDVNSLSQKVQQLLSLEPADREALQQALQARAADFGIERFMDQLTRVYDHMKPLVSVILPVFNGEATILRAVASVLGQSHDRLELILVDDGSTDNTLSQLSRIRDDRLKVISQPNQGVAVARNHAFEQAQGEWIAFLDADDQWLSNKLERELRIIHQHTTPDQPACLVTSGYFAVNDQDALIHQPPMPHLNGDCAQAVLDEEGLFLPSTTLVHRQIVEAVGGFKPGCYHEDRVFFIEACQHYPAFSTGERLVLYRQSMSGRCRQVLQNYEQALSAELSILDNLQGILSPAKLHHLRQLQQRNLFFRFLMYNFFAHALRLFQEYREDKSTPATDTASPAISPATPHQSANAHHVSVEFFSGKKGLLAKLSIQSRFNWMSTTRWLVQGITQTLIGPVWAGRIQSRLSSTSNLHIEPTQTHAR